MKAFNEIRYYDYHIYRFFHGAIHGREWLNEFYLFFAKYGIVLIVLSFIYLIWRKKINAFVCSFLALSLASFIDLIILLVWKRPRPFVSHQNEIITPIIQGLKVNPVSFPSGHTYICFAIATSVYMYGHRRLGSVLFVIAILVAIGRMGAGLHYPSDVIGGALLGIASGIVAFLIVQKKLKKWNPDIKSDA